MSRAIKRLAVRSFRGATQLAEITLEQDKPLVVIFGENGCGKSSLVDAVDFVANRSFGSLMHRSVDGQRHPYLPSLGDTLEDIEINLETVDGGQWTARLVNCKPSIERTSQTGVLPIVRALRRAEILDIVEATPAKRYEALSPFIDASSYERGEVSLREALRRSESSYDQAVARQEQATRSLEELWRAEGSPQGSAEVWAKSKSQESVDDLRDRETTLKGLQKAAGVLETSIIAYGKAAALHVQADQDLAQVREGLNALPPLGGSDAVQLVTMLREAAPLVTEERTTEQCPLCLQPKSGKELRESIQQRLDELGDYVELGDRLEQAEQKRTSRRDALETSSVGLAQAVIEFATTADTAKAELTAEGRALLSPLVELLAED